jgi:RimJ/RimL family protein N-acetyltransferase
MSYKFRETCAKRRVDPSLRATSHFGMTLQPPFKTATFVGREPSEADGAFYARLYGASGAGELARNIQDFERNQIAPWTLELAGRDVGVGGFRLGFGQDEGMELYLRLLPNGLPIGLAAEFLAEALLFADATLRADRLFALVDEHTTFSARMLQRHGFEAAGPAPRPGRPDLAIMRWGPPS